MLLQLTDASVVYTVPEVEHKIKTLGSMFKDLTQKKKTREFVALAPVNTVIRPGTMTLILAPPGHGKSTLLKLLAGDFEGQHAARGKVLINGRTSSENATHNVFTNRMTAFVDQVDCHSAHLTTSETFEFANRNAYPSVASFQDQRLNELYADRVPALLEALGLNECADTVVGNAMIRGVSGGQKKRVSLGEMMLTNSRVLLLDEITSGLDSAASVSIFRTLHQWCQMTRGSVVTALLQPTPELFAQFDNIILLREGWVIFDGPRADLPDYLAQLGLPCPANVDLADFITELLTNPTDTFDKLCSSKVVRWHSDDKQECLSLPTPPLTTDALVESFRRSKLYQQLQLSISAADRIAPIDESKFSEFSRLSYGCQYPLSTFEHFKHNLWRGSKLTLRSLPTFIIPLLLQSITMGIVLGTLYLQLSDDKFADKIGLLLFAVVSVSVSLSVRLSFVYAQEFGVWQHGRAAAGHRIARCGAEAAQGWLLSCDLIPVDHVAAARSGRSR